MTQGFNHTHESQVDQEVSQSSAWLTDVLLPSLVLAVLAAAVIGAYAWYQQARSLGELLSIPRPAQIAFMSDRDGNWEIYIMDRDGGNLLKLTNNPGPDGIPIHSPGQKKLIFSRDQDGSGLDLFSVDLDGSNLTNITQSPDGNEIPLAWSPDGQHLAFLSDQNGQPEIFLAGVDGAGAINLSQEQEIQSFDDWSPGSDRFLATSQSATGMSLLVTDPPGEASRALTDGSYPAGAGRWSPDGQQIAFMAIEPGAAAVDIFVVDAAGGDPTNLTRSQSNDLFPHWSPDGTKIAFLSDRDGNPEIYVMDVDGSNLTNLTNSPASESVQGDFEWSPDGDQIIFLSDRDTDVEIYVMDADGNNQVNLSNAPGTDRNAIWVQ